MIRTHIIKDGIVVNTILATTEEAASAFQDAAIVDASLGGSIGDRYENGEFIKPAPEPEPVPASCTPAQGLVALYAQKGITEDQLLQAIENIPDAVQKYTVRIGFQRAITWERYSQSTQVMAQLLQLTEEDLDNLFEFAVTVSV